MRLIKLTLLIFCLASLSGCSGLGTFNPATGRSEFIFIPTDTEVDMGKQMHPQIVKQYPLSTDQVQVSRVQRIGQKLALVSDRQDYAYQFFLLQSKDINAFTIPGGRIYIFSKLEEGLKSDDEIAAVLAHEIGHCAARHTVKKYQAALGYDLVENFIFSQLKVSDFAKQVASMSTSSLMSLVFSSYGRQDEYESDRLGLKYMRLAGYDMQGMVRVLEFLEKGSKDQKIPLILRSHPYLSDRIVAVQKEIDRLNNEKLLGTAGLRLNNP